jgi:hypothetical protein
VLHKPHPSILNLNNSQEICLTAVVRFAMKPVAGIDPVKRACLVALALGARASPIYFSKGYPLTPVDFIQLRSIVQQAT